MIDPGLVRKVLFFMSLVLFLWQFQKSLVQLQATEVLAITRTVPQRQFRIPAFEFCQVVSYAPQGNDSGDTMAKAYARKGVFHEVILGMTYGVVSSETINYLSPVDKSEWTEHLYPLELGASSKYAHLECYALYMKNKSTAIGGRKGVTIYLNASKALESSSQPRLEIFINEPEQYTLGDQLVFGGDSYILDADDLRNKSVVSYQIYDIDKKIVHAKPIEGQYECSSRDDQGQTLQRCLRGFYGREMQCESPYGESNRPICSTAAHLAQMKALFQRIASKDASYFMHDLGCALPCQKTAYKMYSAYNYPLECPRSRASCEGLMAIQLVSSFNHVDEITQKWLYDVNNFISDIGGYLGLLLGVSILTLYDYAYLVYEKFEKNMNII